MPIQLLGAIIGLPGTDAKPCAPERKAVFTKGALEKFQIRHGDDLRDQGEKEADMPGLKVVPGELPSICLFTGNDKAHAYTDKGQVHIVSEIDSKLQWSGKPAWLGELMPTGNVRMLDPGTLVAYLVCSIDELVLALQEHFDSSEINNIAKWGAALLMNWNGHPPSVCYMVKDPETGEILDARREYESPYVAGRTVLLFRRRTGKCIIGVRGTEVIMRQEGHPELVLGTLGMTGSLNTILEFKEDGSIDVRSRQDFKRIATYQNYLDLVEEAKRLKFQQNILDAICQFGASTNFDYSLCREVFDVRSLRTDDLNPTPIGKSETSFSPATVQDNLARNVKMLVLMEGTAHLSRDDGHAWPVFWDTGSYATFEEAERHGATYPGENLDGWVNVVDMLFTAHAAVRCIDGNTSCACRLYDSRSRKRHIDLSMRTGEILPPPEPIMPDPNLKPSDPTPGPETPAPAESPSPQPPAPPSQIIPGAGTDGAATDQDHAREIAEGAEQITCKKCGCDLDANGYCTDTACPYNEWPQSMPLADLENMSVGEIEAKHGVKQRDIEDEREERASRPPSDEGYPEPYRTLIEIPPHLQTRYDMIEVKTFARSNACGAEFFDYGSPEEVEAVQRRALIVRYGIYLRDKDSGLFGHLTDVDTLEEAQRIFDAFLTHVKLAEAKNWHLSEYWPEKVSEQEEAKLNKEWPTLTPFNELDTIKVTVHGRDEEMTEVVFGPDQATLGYIRPDLAARVAANMEICDGRAMAIVMKAIMALDKEECDSPTLRDLKARFGDSPICLSKRELATVMAALRYWQGRTTELARSEDDIANDAGTPLSDTEIDLLCEQLNFGDIGISAEAREIISQLIDAAVVNTSPGVKELCVRAQTLLD